MENGAHWVLDVEPRGDRIRARSEHAAEQLATLHRLSLILLKREKTKKSGIRGKQLSAGWEYASLLKHLGF